MTAYNKGTYLMCMMRRDTSPIITVLVGPVVAAVPDSWVAMTYDAHID